MKRYENIQTLEEYTAEIKRHLIEGFGMGKEPDFETFFNSDDVQKKIKRDFNTDYESLKQGEITQQVFDIGCTSAVANCLFYMF